MLDRYCKLRVAERDIDFASEPEELSIKIVYGEIAAKKMPESYHPSDEASKSSGMLFDALGYLSPSHGLPLVDHRNAYANS